MMRLEFSEKDLEELKYYRFQHPHPRVQLKMEALLLKAKGLPHQQIANCLDICENTLRKYLAQFAAGGVEGLKALHFHQPSSALADYAESLEAYFREHPPVSIAQAVTIIEELTGIKRSPTQVGVFLKKLGLKRLKTYSVPAKFDAEQQATFKKTNWSRVWSKPVPENGASSSWIAPTSC
jgi:transposase